MSSVVALARLGYLLLILLATLTGSLLTLDFGMALEHLRRAVNPGLGTHDVVDAARNLALFAGWGVVWMITAPGRELRRAVVLATMSGAAISLLVEAVQLFSPVRNASVLDILTNSAGALAGAVLVLAAIVTLVALKGKRSFVGVPAMVFAAAYGIAVALEALMPLFRQERVPGAWGGPGNRLTLAIDYARADPLGQVPMLDLLLFLPAGFFIVAAAVELGATYRRAAAAVGLGAPLILAFIQLARGLMGYPIELAAVLTLSAAIGLGAVLGALVLPPLTTRLRGRHRPLALFVVYVLVLLLWSWRPFMLAYGTDVMAAQVEAHRLVPMRSLYEQVTMFSVAAVGVQLLLFVPFGALLAVWPLRVHGPLAHLLPAVYLALALELGQIVIIGHYFDSTELLLRLSGAAVAWLLVRRSDFPVYGEAVPAARG